MDNKPDEPTEVSITDEMPLFQKMVRHLLRETAPRRLSYVLFIAHPGNHLGARIGPMRWSFSQVCGGEWEVGVETPVVLLEHHSSSDKDHAISW
jgi:hypothetical protein